MQVKELIRELKKYPQDYKVGVQMHDNSEGEFAGNVLSVVEYDPPAVHDSGIEPEKGGWVILKC